MDDEEKKILEENFKNVEFNNLKEDEKVIKEKIVESREENNYKKYKTIISGLCVCIGLLIIVLIVVLIPKNEDNQKMSEAKANDDVKEKNELNDTPKDFSETLSSHGYVYFNKYVYVNDFSSNNYVSDLNGKRLVTLNTSDSVFPNYSDKSLYIISNDEMFMVKKLVDDKVVEIFNGKADGLLENDDNTLLGLYYDEPNYSKLYLFNNNSYDTINLDKRFAYTFSLGQGKSRYVYNNRYVVTSNSNKKSILKFGLFDIKEKKQLFDDYNKVGYLNDDKFVAVKNGKAGIVDDNNKIIVDFDYSSISYSNGFYFVGVDNSLQILDSNFNKLDSSIEISNLSKFDYDNIDNPYLLYEFGDNVVIEIINDSISSYVVVESNGNTTPLGRGKIGFVDNYLIKSNDNDSTVTMYDFSLNPVHVLDAGVSNIDLSNTYIYLKNLLCIDGKKFFNLDDDSNKGIINTFRRTYQGYEVKLYFEGPYGKLTISKEDVILKELDNVSVNQFLSAENNGITTTKNYFIYNAGGVAILKNEASMVGFLYKFDF